MDNREKLIRLWFAMWLEKRIWVSLTCFQIMPYILKAGDRNTMVPGKSLIEWTPDGKIALLKEFGCNENRYDPYKDGMIPHFREESAKWF